ncbi:MAG: hypothetical protein AAFR58_04930 [Cyanobacteria bacterium J06627_28]
MDTTQLIKTLNKQGVRLWADGDKLRIDAPKGVLTTQLKASIAANKAEILNSLLFGSLPSGNCNTPCGLSLQTVGQLIGGSQTALPVIDPQTMAKRLRVTFRPLPEGSMIDPAVLELGAALSVRLQDMGVNIIPWEQATRPFQPTLPVVGSFFYRRFPNLRWPTIAVVCSEIDAVFDVERPESTVNQIRSWIAERLYQVSSAFCGVPSTVSEITRKIGWAEDHAIQRLEDPTATQVVLITALDKQFINPAVPYIEKIGQGVETLISQFSEIVIGVSASQISILNMNLSDSVFPRSELEQFVARSLIPKLYVPIAPLPLSRFQISEYIPAESPYARALVNLSQSLSTTGLFPAGFKLSQVVRRRSHRDIVSAILKGRTGVSYGFVAYAEPPIYVGPKEIAAADWQELAAVEHFSSEEVRQTEKGRRYIRTIIDDRTIYQQIPDIWLVCSRSGADKTNLDISSDVIRIGLTHSLQLQLPQQPNDSKLKVDIRPSYDTYVMVAIALAAALYMPELADGGAPIIHFHGYPTSEWFGQQESFAGYSNPAVPCGTYESGVFNFLSIHQLAAHQSQCLKLAGLIEPDHGINLLADNVDYLLTRLREGMSRLQIELGGRYLPTLTAESAAQKQQITEPKAITPQQRAIHKSTVLSGGLL